MEGDLMKYHRTIFLSFILILQFGCIHKTVTRSSLDPDDPVYTTPPQLKCSLNPSAKPKFVKGGALTGGRSRASIMRGIMPILNQFRKLYNEEYPDSCKPTLKVVVFFKIDYLGNVVSCEVSKSNSSNPKFDSAILVIVKSTKFEEIDLKNDITEVIYPLCFSK
jgi:outer membrane biosynthesis protein TonB